MAALQRSTSLQEEGQHADMNEGEVVNRSRSIPTSKNLNILSDEFLLDLEYKAMQNGGVANKDDGEGNGEAPQNTNESVVGYTMAIDAWGNNSYTSDGSSAALSQQQSSLNGNDEKKDSDINNSNSNITSDNKDRLMNDITSAVAELEQRGSSNHQTSESEIEDYPTQQAYNNSITEEEESGGEVNVTQELSVSIGCGGINQNNETLDLGIGCDNKGCDIQSALGAACPLTHESLSQSNNRNNVDTKRQQKQQQQQEDNYTDVYTDIFSDDDDSDDSVAAAPSEAQSEASMLVLWRYMGLSKRKYMTKPPSASSSSLSTRRIKKEGKIVLDNNGSRCSSNSYKPIHDLQVGDHVIRWKMLGYCYPIQVHGIVFSAGPDVVTIVDCGLDSYSDGDIAGSFDDDDDSPTKKKKSKGRRRMNVLTLVDEKEIKKWTKIRYGEEVTLEIHSTNEEMHKRVEGKALPREPVIEEEEGDDEEDDDENVEQEPKESELAGLEMEEVEKCNQATISESPEKSSWFSRSSCKKNETKEGEKENTTPEKLCMPKADPPQLVIARLRFLLEHGERPWIEDDNDKDKEAQQQQHKHNLLPPNHLLYANSECIAVYCKTGRWSTLQAAIFLHSSTVGNIKQTATVTAFLSAQTATVPASGLWGFFGGTTTVTLFTAQPWLVPALVGGGAVYIGLPMIMLWKAKGRWGHTEKRLNVAFWSIHNSEELGVEKRMESIIDDDEVDSVEDDSSQIQRMETI